MQRKIWLLETRLLLVVVSVRPGKLETSRSIVEPKKNLKETQRSRKKCAAKLKTKSYTNRNEIKFSEFFIIFQTQQKI